MDEKVLVIGGGLAGLTAAAYLSRAGIPTLLCEKETKTGGLVNSFDYQGFVFDGGIRALENSGIVRPMLRQLGIDLPLIRNGVSIGIGSEVINLASKDSLRDYLDLLRRQFPEQSREIDRFGGEIVRIMHYMDILYGIDNPLFLDLKQDREYLMRTILPWMFKYLVTINKIVKLDRPVVGYLRRLLCDQSLIDVIAQHFFQDTPTFFALSYFSLYLDYAYPRGGTGTLAAKMEQYVREHGGEIRCGTEINRIDLTRRQAEDSQGNSFTFRQLVWAADLKRLYQAIDLAAVSDQKTRRIVAAKRQELAPLKGGDSVMTLFLTVDRAPADFAAISQPHFFYTPLKDGLSTLNKTRSTAVTGSGNQVELSPAADWPAVQDWLRRYLRLTTYEISCPALRDASLAPAGQTGLIVSTLFDYGLVKQIADRGWYDSCKDFCAREMIAVLNESIYPGLQGKVIDSFVSTPLTLARRTGNTEGAITGWAFTNRSLPIIHTMPKVARSVRTPLPGVWQAGQWVFSPSGLPISILTGKLAADRVIKALLKPDRSTPG